jgi:hypothetical protein
MNDAMEDCCDNVWAILELSEPPSSLLGVSYPVTPPSESVDSDAGGSATDTDSRAKTEISDGLNTRKSAIRRRSPKSHSLRDVPVISGESSDHVSSEEGDLLGSAKREDWDTAASDDELMCSGDLDLEGSGWLSRNSQKGGPSLTIRMQPSAIPDTRNFE